MVLRFNLNYINLILLLLLIVLIGFIFNIQINPILQISFILNLLLITIGIYYYINSHHFNISNGVVIIFFFLFYFIAPILQLENNSLVLINTVNTNLSLLLLTNSYVFLFISSYLLTLFLIKKGEKEIDCNISFHYKDKVVFFILFLVSLFAAKNAFGEITNIFSNLEIEFDNEANESIKILFVRKVLYIFPYVTFAIFLFRKKINFHSFILFSILIILVTITKNPLLDRRNALGPIYLSLLLILFRKYFNTNLKIFILLVTSMLVFFPLTSLFTHVSFDRLGEESIDYVALFKDHFIDLHYDAWANIPAGILYVEKNGFTYGNQLLGSVAFWIPRSLWESKSIATGELIGNFLMQFENLHFNNISATIILEGFIDFGFIGVILYGILLAVFVSFLDKMYYSKSISRKIFSIYTSIFLFFILRGALLPAIAYLSGAWIAIIVIPYLIKKILGFFIGSKLQNLSGN